VICEAGGLHDESVPAEILEKYVMYSIAQLMTLSIFIQKQIDKGNELEYRKEN
jgi:hypothetical protein